MLIIIEFKYIVIYIINKKKILYINVFYHGMNIRLCMCLIRMIREVNRMSKHLRLDAISNPTLKIAKYKLF